MTPQETQVSLKEIMAIGQELNAKRICFAGCTDAALHDRYGDAVRHIAGYGWVVDRRLAAKLKKQKES